MAREWYISEAQQINLQVREILGLEPDVDKLFVAALPTLDNNIWSDYHSAAALIVGKIGEPVESSRCASRGLIRRNIRYSTFGIVLETLVLIASRSWKTHFPGETDPRFSNSAILGFTFSDVDSVLTSSSGRSIIWGELPSWTRESRSIIWIGFGKTNLASNYPFVGPRSIRKISDSATREYFKSLHSRIRMWRRMKRALSSFALFRVLKREFRRSILGAPALEALRLTEVFQDLLSEFSPRAVLLPYENQLWQRILSQLAQAKSVKVIGAMHSTARFWDLRFLSPGAFLEFSPTSYVTNGRASEELLLSFGIPKKLLLPGTALRFSQLKEAVSAKECDTTGGKFLVVTGIDALMTEKMISAILNFHTLDFEELVFRPHPAATRWFRRQYPDLPVDDRELDQTLAEYDVFICDSMSSLAFEFAAFGRRVLIYKPEGQLNFSPLALVKDFTSYFSDEESFEHIRHLPPHRLDFAEYLRVGGDKRIWNSLLRRIVD